MTIWRATHLDKVDRSTLSPYPNIVGTPWHTDGLWLWRSTNVLSGWFMTPSLGPGIVVDDTPLADAQEQWGIYNGQRYWSIGGGYYLWFNGSKWRISHIVGGGDDEYAYSSTIHEDPSRNLWELRDQAQNIISSHSSYEAAETAKASDPDRTRGDVWWEAEGGFEGYYRPMGEQHYDNPIGFAGEDKTVTWSISGHRRPHTSMIGEYTAYARTADVSAPNTVTPSVIEDTSDVVVGDPRWVDQEGNHYVKNPQGTQYGGIRQIDDKWVLGSMHGHTSYERYYGEGGLQFPVGVFARGWFESNHPPSLTAPVIFEWVYFDENDGDTIMVNGVEIEAPVPDLELNFDQYVFGGFLTEIAVAQIGTWMT